MLHPQGDMSHSDGCAARNSQEFRRQNVTRLYAGQPLRAGYGFAARGDVGVQMENEEKGQP